MPQNTVKNILTEGKIQDIEIIRLASDGAGVGYIDGKATFVRGMLPGEKGKVRILEEKPNYQRAEIMEVMSTSPDRQQPVCFSYDHCGGCDLQHLKYDVTLKWKKQWVEDALHRIGGLQSITVEPVIGMEEPWRYRNKAVLHRDKDGKLGYYQEKTHTVIEFPDCHLLSENTNRRIKKLQETLGTCCTDIKSASFRESNRGKGLLLLEGQTGSDDLTHKVKKLKNITEFYPQNCSVIFPKHKQSFEGSGAPYLNEYIDDIRFRVSPRAFLQVNPIQTQKLYSLILDWAELTGKEEVWDLYAGIGTITLMLAKRSRKVIGVEENPHAVEDAIENAKDNSIQNVQFIQGKVEEKLKALPETADLVVTDPPRAGMDKAVIERLLKSRPKRIIYVSCNPATLARDLKLLVDDGEKSSDKYRVVKVQPVDMFPWTSHVECVVLMSRVEK